MNRLARLLISKITAEYNLGKLYPELVKEWHPTKNGQLTSYDVTPNSGKKVWWICNQGHESTTIGFLEHQFATYAYIIWATNTFQYGLL